MLDACGASTPEELFAHLPEAVRLNRPLNLAPGISEYEIVDYFRDLGAGCATGYASFLGAGVYNHFRPVLVDTDRKSTRLNSSHLGISYAVFCLKKSKDERKRRDEAGTRAVAAHARTLRRRT